MTASALTIEALSAGYRHRPVIRDLTLAPLKAGEITALVGPNAAGKSTLLRALAGLVRANGRVRFGDVDLLGLQYRDRARYLTFMPQTLPSGVELTVIESLFGALRASAADDDGPTRAEARQRASAVLDRLGLADIALEMIDRLSGGQRQMVALAQVLIREPKILLLDEPTSALDLRHQADVMNVVRSLAREGRIVVTVLHDLTLAARWADHVVVLDDGRMAAQGTPAMAITPSVLRDVYDIEARVESCSHGSLQVVVDGPTERKTP